MFIPDLHGIQVHLNQHVEKQEWKQVRFPRSKRRRIRNKWSKRSENFGYVPGPPAYLMAGKYMFVGPVMLKLLKRKFQE